MRPAFAILPLFALTASPVVGAPAGRAEMRGLWVVRTALTSPASVDRVVDQAQQGGFNALFVQVRGRGDAFYRSGIVARSPLLAKQPADFDPLGRLLERAQGRGLEVHAWFNVLLSASFSQTLPIDHVVAQHPDWVMVPRVAASGALATRGPDLLKLIRDGSRSDSDVEGFYLSPSAPGVALHLESAVQELVQRYRLDGLHLDFIRYPGTEYDYSRAALESFSSRTVAALMSAVWKDPEGWESHRRDVLTALVERLSRTARVTRPGVVVSAAVVPDEAQASRKKFQSWGEWMSRGLLDAVCPMTYTPESQVFRRQVQAARSRVGAGRPLWAGIGAYRLPVAEVIERIGVARASGASGVILFSHESLSSADLPRILRAFSQASATLPVSSPANRSNDTKPR